MPGVLLLTAVRCSGGLSWWAIQYCLTAIEKARVASGLRLGWRLGAGAG